MASTVASGIFNAMAFAGGGLLFKKLDENGYKDEMKRHNRANEKFYIKREKWQERQVLKKDKIASLRQKLIDADKNFDSVNTHSVTQLTSGTR